MEYEVRLLEPMLVLSPKEGVPALFESDCLGKALTFLDKYYAETNNECCVYQPRHEFIRGHHKNS